MENYSSGRTICSDQVQQQQNAKAISSGGHGPMSTRSCAPTQQNTPGHRSKQCVSNEAWVARQERCRDATLVTQQSKLNSSIWMLLSPLPADMSPRQGLKGPWTQPSRPSSHQEPNHPSEPIPQMSGKGTLSVLFPDSQGQMYLWLWDPNLGISS